MRSRDGTLPADAQRRIGFPWSPQMVERSRRSVGATLAAARTVRAIDATRRIASLAGSPCRRQSRRRHASRLRRSRRGLLRLQRRRGRRARPAARRARSRRAVVVDCDVHQGNGTAAIFRDEPSVFTFSMHGAKQLSVPEGSQRSRRHVRRRHGRRRIPGGAGRAPAARARRAAADFVFYLAGADPYEGDRLGRLKLTIAGLQARDRLVFDACRARGLPVVVAMSGGYATDVDAIVTIHVNTIKAAVHRAQSARRSPLAMSNSGI